MDLARAVAKTIAYAGFFNFSLSAQEIHFWLISSHPISFSSIKKYLPTQKPQEAKIRQILQKNTTEKEQSALKLIKYVSLFPFIRLIALTGSVAANNTKTNDDLDLLVVTSPHTLWLTRPLFLIFLSLKFNRRHPGDTISKEKNVFCPNLWLDTQALSIPQRNRNIYTAHEVLQIKPIFDRGDTYQRFIDSNHWTSRFLANAYQELHRTPPSKLDTSFLFIFFFPLNFIFFVMQYLYMLPKKTTEAVSLHSAYFHKNNPILSLTNYLQRNSL